MGTNETFEQELKGDVVRYFDGETVQVFLENFFCNFDALRLKVVTNFKIKQKISKVFSKKYFFKLKFEILLFVRL